MKCREAKYWIFSCRPNAAWPLDLVTHLQQCADCQALQAELRQMDQKINQIGSTPSKNDLKGQILALIKDAPQTPAPKRTAPKPKSRRQWHHPALYLAGAAALILFGWFLGRYKDIADPGKTLEVVSEKAVEAVRDKIASVNASADRNLFAALLKRNARLVQGSQAKDRLEALLDMADDCRQHALRLIEEGPRDSLPLTIDLYVQLLREGVLVLLAQAPEDNRATLQTTARARLEKMAAPPALPASELPRIVEQQRDILQNATRETMERVNRVEASPVPAPARKNVLPESIAPAAALVLYAVTFSSDPDPISRADSCAECVQRLMPYMMLYLADDSFSERTEMGQQFGEMINHGVYAPLELATAKDPPKQVKEKAERIFGTASIAVADMEKNLLQAPDAAKPALERAIEASNKGWEKGKGKGKGPPWKHTNEPEKKGPAKGKASHSPKVPQILGSQRHASMNHGILSACLSERHFILRRQAMPLAS